MGNMSYCRFENTVDDLEDCQEHISDDIDELTHEERRARRKMIRICKEIAADFEDSDE